MGADIKPRWVEVSMWSRSNGKQRAIFVLSEMGGRDFLSHGKLRV